jgi:hypothetical protein
MAISKAGFGANTIGALPIAVLRMPHVHGAPSEDDHGGAP